MLKLLSKVLYSSLGILFFYTSLFAQVTSLNLNNKNFVKENNHWYVISNSGTKYLVNETSITVKLKEQISKNALDNLMKNLNFTVERENKLGFIDLKLSEDSKFYEIFNHLENARIFESIDVNSFGKIFIDPNDPGYSNQYYLNYNSSYPNIGWSGINYFEDGSTNPQIVALIDMGVDYYNTDINMHSNLGWDFIDDDNTPYPSEGDDHATGLAGIIAAKTNNNLAVSGIAGGWNSGGAKIMSLRVGSKHYNYWRQWVSYIDVSVVDDAIIYAADNGAKIINMSIGTNDDQSIINALNYAYKEKGCVLIAAAGNGDSSPISFPASHDLVIAVGGIKLDWTQVGNYGIGLDIVAPYQNYHSTLLRYPPQNPPEDHSDYGLWGSGTSPAAAAVSGIAALLLSYNPSLIPLDLRLILRQTAYRGFGGYSEYYFGKGLVRTDPALEQLDNPPVYGPHWPTNVSASGSIGQSPTISWSSQTEAVKYNVYKATIYGASQYGRYHFTKAAEVTSGTSWTDNSVTITNPQYSTSTHYYKVTSLDQFSYESITSAEVSVNGNWSLKNKTLIADDNPYDYKLYNNYPNPFNPSTTIKFSIKEREFVKLIVYDILGRAIKVLVNDIRDAGTYNEIFDASNSLAGGTYFYQLTTNHFVKTGKMQLLK